MQSHRFSLRDASLGDHVHLIEVYGDFEAGTTERLRALLNRVIKAGKTHVVVDLSETTFLDSTAIAALFTGARSLRRPGGSLALVASRHAQPRGRFDMTGSGNVLSVCATRDEALELVERPQAPPPSRAVRFCLYVDGASANAHHAVDELEELRRRHLPDAEIEVVDITQHPGAAERERLLASPMLVRISPKPVRRIVGDLSDHEQVLHALDLHDTSR